MASVSVIEVNPSEIDDFISLFESEPPEISDNGDEIILAAEEADGSIDVLKDDATNGIVAWVDDSGKCCLLVIAALLFVSWPDDKNSVTLIKG